MVLAAPHHEATAKTHHMVLDVDHARFTPGLEDPIHRPAAVEVFDVGAEKPACPPPRRATERIARCRHDDAGVDAPARAPQGARWHKEVEARHATGRPQHTCELLTSVGWVGDVA